MVKRKDTWVKDLAAYLKERRSMPFEWGKNDCLKFAAGAVKAVTDTDFTESYPPYHDEEGAKQLLETHGGVQSIITNHLGKGNKNVIQAGRGDIALMKLPEYTTGVVDDSGQYVVVITPFGIRRIRLDKAVKIWSY